MRRGREAWLLPIVLAIAGCHTDSKSIARARELHDTGHLQDALTALKGAEAEGSSQWSDAKALAVTWLVDASKEKRAERAARYWLEDALKWDPESGHAQIAMCAFEKEEGGFEALRYCLEEELKGKSDVPYEELETLKKTLAKHDADEADSNERRRLLASSDVRDLETLRTRWPESREAARAAGKIARTRSLCEDVRHFVVPLLAEGKWTEKIVSRVKNEKDDEKQLAMYKVIVHEAEERGTHFAELKGEVQNHAYVKGEEPLRDRLVDAYDLLIATHAHMFDESTATPEKPALVTGRDSAATALIIAAKNVTSANVAYCKERGVDPQDPGLDDYPSGELAPGAMAWVIPGASQDVRRCYELALQKRPSLRGKIAVRFTVEFDGKVDKIEDWGSQITDPTMLSCVTDSIRKVVFPETPTGRAILVWPWRMTPKPGDANSAPSASTNTPPKAAAPKP